MTVQEFRKYFPDVKMSDEAVAACYFLQREGLKICVDFGYENAPAMAWARIEAEYESEFAQ